jgi:hypothetical protein
MINRAHLNRDRAPKSLFFLKASGFIAGAFFITSLSILTLLVYKKQPTRHHSEREIQNMANDIANGKTSGQLSIGGMLCLFKMGGYGKNN